MAEPWPIVSRSRQEAIDLYYGWVFKNFAHYNSAEQLCNWYPLRVLVEFAAQNGVRLRLDYWPGRAPTNGGKRHWDTRQKLIHDSHDGTFASKAQYLSRVQSTVTARMIGSINTLPVEQAQARLGDLISKDYSNDYWHLELITRVHAKGLTTESGSTPKVAPKSHRETYKDVSKDRDVYQGKPRCWEFVEVFGLEPALERQILDNRPGTMRG